MNYMKKLILLIVVLSFGFSLFAQELQKEAEKAYSKGNYTLAAELYESILKEKGQSSDLYYNLGNAYYKGDKVALSILNLERALLLAPGDEDIRHNLEIARLKTVDKIIPVGTFLLSDWVKSVQMQMNSNDWAKAAVILFLLFVTALFVYFFAGRIWMKKFAFFGGVFMLMISLFANYAAYAQKKVLINRSHAIIFSSSVVTKSTPDESGTDLFLIHEGTKVTLKDKVGDWTQIELEDGNDGWIQNTHFEVIALK